MSTTPLVGPLTVDAPRTDYRFVTPDGRLTETAYAFLAKLVRRTGGIGGLSMDELSDLIQSLIGLSPQLPTSHDTLPDVVQSRDWWPGVLADLMQPAYAPAVPDVVMQPAAPLHMPEMVLQPRDFTPDIAAAVSTAISTATTTGLPGTNILLYITPSLWPAIVAGTSTTNVAVMIQDALDSERVLFFPRGKYTITAPITIPRGVSVIGYQANIVCDFTTVATWGLPLAAPSVPENPEEGVTIHSSESYIVRCITLPGMNGTALNVDDEVCELSGLVVTSVNPHLVRATAIYQPQGKDMSQPAPYQPPEPVAVLYSKYNYTIDNVMVDGFDTGFYFGNMRQCSFSRLKTRSVRVGIDIRGRNIWNVFAHCDLYTEPGTIGVPGSGWKAATLYHTGSVSVGFDIDAYYYGGVYPTNPVRPEDILLTQCCVLGFNTVIHIEQGLLIKVQQSTLDSSTLYTGGTIYTSGATIKVNTQEQVIIRDNWISGYNNGIVCGAHVSPPDMLLIEGNEFNHNVQGIYASARANMRIAGNTFNDLTSFDVRIDDVNQLVVNGNQSNGNTQAGASAASMYFTGISDAAIDDNYTTLPVAVELDTASNINTVIVGRNAGVTSATPHAIGNTQHVGRGNGSDVQVQLGTDSTGNRFSYVDYVGDTTYTDFGLRVGRDNGGANGTSLVTHRGTGPLALSASDAGSITFSTNGVLRSTIASTGATSFTGAVSASAGAVISGGVGLQVFTGLDIQTGAAFAASVTMTGLGNHLNDAAAAAAGVPLGGIYHTAGAVRVRIV